MSLNPFEVREVLQADNVNTGKMNPVSIPLKSGRCCKPVIRLRWCLQQCLNPFEVREVLQGQAKQAQIAEKSQSL